MNDIYRLKVKINYYKRLQATVGTLTPKQQNAFDRYSEQLEQLEPKKIVVTEEEKLEHMKKMIQKNKERAIERYHRLKDDPDFREKRRTISKEWYHNHKSKH